MATAETLDDRLQKVKDELKSIYSMKFDETKGGKDEKREACCAIHDQLKPCKLFPSEFSIDSVDRDGRNDPETAARTSDVADSERKAMKDNPMATPEKLQNKSLKPRKLFDSPPEVNDAPTTVKVIGSTATTTTTEIKIDFKRGRGDPEHLKEKLKEAVAKKSESAQNNIKTFVERHIIDEKNEMLGPFSVSVNKVKIPKYPQYISRKVIELSLAGQVVWETEDGEAAEGTTDFWKFHYRERKLIEAAQLYSSSCKAGNAPENEEEQLLPVMYWMEKKGDTTPDWRRSSRTKDGREEVLSWEKPPDWATAYLNTKSILKRSEGSPKDSTGQKTVKSSGGPHHRQMTDSNEDDDGDDDENVLAEDISNVATLQQFERCNKKGSEPNKHPNAVYLLLCRFNGKGVPEEARVQAYAGKAINGVEKRWLQHSRESQYLLQLYPLLTRFSALPLDLRSSLLVEVVVGRLYAQGGREYITDNDSTDHDNIALFIYNAYGEGKRADMVEKEKDLIRTLKLTDMTCGMNGREG